MNPRGMGSGGLVSGVVAVAVALTGCGPGGGQIVTSTPPGAPARAGSSTPDGASDRLLRNSDGKLSFRVPSDWLPRPCPMTGDDCIDVTPPAAGPGEFINGSFGGMNTVEGSPSIALCLTGAPFGGRKIPGFSQLRLHDHPAFRWDNPAGPGKDAEVLVLVCLGPSLGSAWLVCGLGRRPDVLRPACDRAVTSFDPQP